MNDHVRGNYVASRRYFRRLLDGATPRQPERSKRIPRAELHIWLAEALLAMNLRASAEQEFEQAARVDPCYTISAHRHPQPVVDHYLRARLRVSEKAGCMQQQRRPEVGATRGLSR